MLNFLYLSIAVGIIFIIINLKWRFRKATKELIGKSQENYDKKLYRCMVKSVMLSVCIGFIICFLLPLTIWFVSKKEIALSDRIDDQEKLVVLSQMNNQAYISKKIENNTQYYVIKIEDSVGNDTLLQLDSSSVEIVRVGKGQTPVYEKISQYNIKKLNHSNVICDSVNDIYANVYLDTSHAQYVRQITRLLIPSDAQVVEYEK